MNPRFTRTFLVLLTTVVPTEQLNSCVDIDSDDFRCSGPDIDLAGCNLATHNANQFLYCLYTPRHLGSVDISDQQGGELEFPKYFFAGAIINGNLTIRNNQYVSFKDESFQNTEVKGNVVIENNLLELQYGSLSGLHVEGDLKIKENDLYYSARPPFSRLRVDDAMYIEGNVFNYPKALTSRLFTGLRVTDLIISENQGLASIGAQSFVGLSATNVEISDNPDLASFEPFALSGLVVDELKISHNSALVAIRNGVFDGLRVSSLVIKENSKLVTLEAGLFDRLLPTEEHNSVLNRGRPSSCLLPTTTTFSPSGSSSQTPTCSAPQQSQAVPSFVLSTPCCLRDRGSSTTLTVNGALDDASVCGCPDLGLTFNLCDNGFTCVGGVDGYTCNVSCGDSTECMMDEICCEKDNVCKTVPAGEDYDAFLVACGDPHMTGFHGQKFDFTGEDGFWYALLADDGLHVNMRVTTPVPGLPEITYITGLSVLTTGDDGLQHSIVIKVKDPHTLSSACPAGMPSCLGDGALTVVLDGEEAMLTPGTYSVGPGVTVSAANLPGACRSFGFEKYWERKKVEYAQAGRRLDEKLQDMSEWILGDPTATNLDECMEYLARAALDGNGVFAHQSEHVSFQIVTPISTIRLSHGRLHQVSMRDPTDTYDLPDHLTWQMNVAIDQTDVTPDAKGVLGETIVPTVDALGDYIIYGMESIRGEQEDYLVSGPLEVAFALGKGHQC